MFKSLIGAVRQRLFNFDEKSQTKSYNSIKEFLSDVRRLSLLATRGIALALIVVSLPIAVYLATSPESPLQQGRAATPTATPMIITFPSPQVASPSATPHRLPSNLPK